MLRPSFWCLLPPGSIATAAFVVTVPRRFWTWEKHLLGGSTNSLCRSFHDYPLEDILPSDQSGAPVGGAAAHFLNGKTALDYMRIGRTRNPQNHFLRNLI